MSDLPKNLNDAIDAVHTAAALGETIPAIPGTTVYALTLTFEGRYTSLYGIYPSREQAHRAAADYALDQWLQLNGIDVGPWMEHPDCPETDDDEELTAFINTWLAEANLDDVTDLFFGDANAGEDTYEVVRTRVEAGPKGPLTID